MPMTVGQLRHALASFRPDREVVLDVNLSVCTSDRNILEVSEVADFHPETGLVFINAGASWRADVLTHDEKGAPRDAGTDTNRAG